MDKHAVADYGDDGALGQLLGKRPTLTPSMLTVGPERGFALLVNDADSSGISQHVHRLVVANHAYDTSTSLRRIGLEPLQEIPAFALRVAAVQDISELHECGIPAGPLQLGIDEFGHEQGPHEHSNVPVHVSHCNDAGALGNEPFRGRGWAWGCHWRASRCRHR